MKKFVDWFLGLDAEGCCSYPNGFIRSLEPESPFEFVCSVVRGFTGMSEMISLALLVLKILGHFDGSWIVVFAPVICRVVLELIANLARKFARKKQDYYNKIARNSIMPENIPNYEYLLTHDDEEDGDTF